MAARVLFVDDDALMQGFFESFSERWGYEGAYVMQPADALPTALAMKPELIVLDVHMPVMDGFEVMKLLRAEPGTALIPVIFLTAAAADVASRVSGLEMGAADYLIKPIDAQELRARIDRHVEQYRDRQRLARREVEAVQETAAYLEHSINNLLASIQISAHLLNQDAGGASHRRAEVIKRSVARIHEIVMRLKDIKRIVLTDYAGTETMLDFDESVKEK